MSRKGFVTNCHRLMAGNRLFLSGKAGIIEKNEEMRRLQWFIFPVAGVIFAKYLRHVTDKDSFYCTVIKISTVLLVGLCSALYFAKYNKTFTNPIS